MHTTFCEADGEVIFRPGDEVLDVKAKSFLGPCSATIHLAGYWCDQTKQGPLLYLTKLAMLDAKDDKEMEATVSEVFKSPGGTFRSISEHKIRSPQPDAVDVGDSAREDLITEGWTFQTTPPEQEATNDCSSKSLSPIRRIHEIQQDFEKRQRTPSPPAPSSFIRRFGKGGKGFKPVA
jgi:hypothetical protein